LSTHDHIRTGQSSSKDSRKAVQELHAALSGHDTALVIFFCSSHYDLDALASEINLLFPNIPVVGCTTAGEIGPAGYREYSLSGASFPSSSFLAVVGHHDKLQQFEASKGYDFIETLLQQLEEKKPDAGPKNSFALMLIDGLSKREEPVVNTFQKALGNIGLFGGSAGDDENYEHTWVFCDGAFRTDSVAVVLINTIYPFKLFKGQHLVGNHEKLIVTKANASERLVIEINGLPAAEEYARILGTQVENLSTEQFTAFPVVVRINGMDYVRSIQKINPDGSMTFFCAIERGIVLRIAHGENFIANLEQIFANIHTEMGQPQFVLACDCILRNHEMSHNGLRKAVEKIFKKNNVIGFSTYGEQFMGVHINQTITGLAIGKEREPNND